MSLGLFCIILIWKRKGNKIKYYSFILGYSRDTSNMFAKHFERLHHKFYFYGHVSLYRDIPIQRYKLCSVVVISVDTAYI